MLDPALLRSGLGSLTVKVVGTGLTFAVSIYLARVLGVAGFGVFAFAQTVLMLIAMPMQTGLSHLMVREAARRARSGKVVAVWPIGRWADGVVLRYASVSMVALVAGVALVSGGVTESQRALAICSGVLLLVGVPIAGARGSLVRGLGQVVLGQVPDLIVRPLAFIVLVALVGLALPLSSHPHSAAMAIGAHSMAAIVAALFGHALLRRATSSPSAPSMVTEAREWTRSLRYLYLVSGLQLLNGSADLLLVSAFRTDAETGLYRAAVQLGSLVVFGLAAINQVLHPRFSELHANGDADALQSLVTQSARGIFLIAAVPAVVLVLWGDVILSMTFGEDFREAGLALSIIVIGQLMNATFGSVGALLNMTGHERDTVQGMVLAGVVNIGLNLLLVPLYGITGAATATAASLLCWNVVLWRFVALRLGLESGFWGPVIRNRRGTSS